MSSDSSNLALSTQFNFVGYYIFRSANGEKNAFRNGSNPKSEFSDKAYQDIYARTLSHRVRVYDYEERLDIAYYGLVGSFATPKLYVRQLSHLSVCVRRLIMPAGEI